VAIPENLLESELFGYEKGAFTGAAQRHIGKIEQAHGGTVFLDEIGDMPLNIQAKILRLLQEKKIERLGGGETIPVDVRIIAATNKNLEQAIQEEKFREDLYFRLKVVTIDLPPLRDRRDDIHSLVSYYMAKFSIELKIDNPGIQKEALKRLSRYEWPGNIRELSNLIQKVLIFNRGAPVSKADLEQVIKKKEKINVTEEIELNHIQEWVRHTLSNESEKCSFDDFIDTLSSIVVAEALKVTNGNRSRAAKLLSVSRPTLHAKIDKYNIKLKTEISD
jgi:two-component system nitrogen regulation response regulator GlnG